MTVILVSHSMEDIANNVERIIVMNKGRVVMDGPRNYIFSKAYDLNKIGLGIPTVTKVFLELKKSGYNIPDDIFTVERAKEVIKDLLKEGGKFNDF